MDRIFRLPSVHHSQANLHEPTASNNIVDICVGQAVTKPQPPRPLTLKRDNFTKKGHVVKRKYPERDPFKRQNLAERNSVFGRKGFGKPVLKESDDVLSSLKQLNLIEPFLGKYGQSRAARTALSLSRPVQFSVHGTRENTITEDVTDITPNSDSGIGLEFSPTLRFTDEKLRDKSHASHESSNSNVAQNSNKQQLHSVRDLPSRKRAYDHARNTGDTTHKLTYSSRDAANSQRTGFHMTAPPTATLVDISTGGIVELTSGCHDDDVIVGEVMCPVGGAGVPPSFYFRRNKRKARNREARELKNFRRGRRDFVLEENLSSEDESTSNLAIERNSLQTVDVIEDKVSFVTPTLEIPNKHNSPQLNEFIAKAPTSSLSRATSALSSYSLSSSCKSQPRAPNPTPHLEDNRFQIFPTSVSNTYHVFSGSQNQPTVITLEDTSEEALLRSSGSRAHTKTFGSRKNASGGFRILVTRDRKQREPAQQMDSLVQGSSFKVTSHKKPQVTFKNDDDVNRDVTSSSNDEESSAKESSSTDSKVEPSVEAKSDNGKLTSVQSLVVQSIRSRSPIVVVSNELADAFASEALPCRKQSLPGNLSPLKGVRLLRRKITIKQHAPENLPQTVDKNLDAEDQSVMLVVKTFPRASKSAEKLLRKINYGSDAENGLMPRKENQSSLFRARNNPRLRLATAQGLKPNARDSSGASDDDITAVTSAINVERLCLEGDPCFLLKEGNSQSLNFIDSRLRASAMSKSRAATRLLASREGKRATRRKQLGAVSLNSLDDRVHVKIAAGGGFRSNVAHYSLLLRQRQGGLSKQLSAFPSRRGSSDEVTDGDDVKVTRDADEGRATTFDDILRHGDNGISSPGKEYGENVLAPGNTPEASCLEEAQLGAASMLPDPNSSFRMTNDVSFDEGSRYHGGGNPSMEIRKSADTSQRLKHSATNPTDCSPYSGHGRLDKTADSPSRDRHNHVTSSGYKETMPMSLVRIEERLNFDSALGRHPPNYPGSRGHSAQGRNHSASSCVLATPPAPTLTTFRLHKGRQNWNYKMGDLSVNGGGYYGSSPLQPGARIESSGLGSLSINSASNLSPKLGSQSRERNGITIKSRMSSRYGCRMDSIGHSYNSSSAIRECQYSDPCQSAPASFQQRLMELSVLESETIKYERNRKLKRKKNQDKDS